MHNRFLLHTLMYGAFSFLCTSHALHSMDQEQKYPLIQQTRQKRMCLQHVSENWKIKGAYFACVGASVFTLGIGLDALNQFNQQCPNFTLSSLETNCNGSVDFADMSSSQEHACDCYSLQQNGVGGTLIGSMLTIASISAPAVLALAKWLTSRDQSDNKEPDNSIPTATNIIHEEKNSNV